MSITFGNCTSIFVSRAVNSWCNDNKPLTPEVLSMDEGTSTGLLDNWNCAVCFFDNTTWQPLQIRQYVEQDGSTSGHCDNSIIKMTL